MDFASKYVYAKKRAQRNALIPPAPAQPQAASLIDFGSEANDDEPDTNVISARFDHLVETRDAHAGDAYFCGKCEAVLSKMSRLSEPDLIDKKRTWKCEFCNFENKLAIDLEEIPKSEEVTYIIEPPSEKMETNQNEADSKYLLYCIDISGSMSVTTQVPGNFVLPTDEIRRETLRNITGEYIQNPFRNQAKHISRLEALQVAIDDNFNKLEKNNPDKKVGIITFNQSVTVIGDGKMNKIKLADGDLENKDQIKAVADRTPEFEIIKNNKANLRDKLLNLEEGGATALGPALYYSILVASRKSGSQVILCTDGLANKGIGSLENENQEEINQFYNEIGDFALSKGVSVSIITIEGTNCKLGLLGDIANKTGGIVNVVNPLNLKEEFSSILDEPIIATNVVSTLILHQALYIKDHANFDNKQSTIKKEIGNVTKDTEITFEFSVRDDMEIKEKELPFQLKITYNLLDGTKSLRVLTKLKQVTDDKTVAETNSDRRILASNIIQTQSKLMQANSEMVKFNEYSSYVKKLQPINDAFSTEAYEKIETEMTGARQRALNKNSSFFSRGSRGRMNYSLIPPAPLTTSVAPSLQQQQAIPSDDLFLNRAPSSSNALAELDDADASRFYNFGRMKKAI